MEQDREDRREEKASGCEAAEGHGSRTSSARAGGSVELRCVKRGGDPSQEQGYGGNRCAPCHVREGGGCRPRLEGHSREYGLGPLRRELCRPFGPGGRSARALGRGLKSTDPSVEAVWGFELPSRANAQKSAPVITTWDLPVRPCVVFPESRSHG